MLWLGLHTLHIHFCSVEGESVNANTVDEWPWLTLEMTKNIDSDPDINQLQFILYQYARACHIVEKTKTLESDLDEFDVKDFVYRKRCFNEISLDQLFC